MMLVNTEFRNVGYACDAVTGIVTPSPRERGQPTLPAQRVLSHSPRVLGSLWCDEVAVGPYKARDDVPEKRF